MKYLRSYLFASISAGLTFTGLHIHTHGLADYRFEIVMLANVLSIIAFIYFWSVDANQDEAGETPANSG
jgi:hypothetical protein